MDLNQAASILKTLNDQQLQKEYMQPAAGVPQFLILTELQRRKQLRAAAQPKPVDTTPVAQELLNSGVAATPQMSEGSAPAGMMQGGVVGYAGGGLLGDIDNLIGASQEDMKRYWEERRAKQQAARTAAGPIPQPPMPTAPQLGAPAPMTSTPPMAAAANINSMARGMRNNNPGNIRASGSTWVGQIGVDPQGFVIFDTPESGQRAMRMNLQTYSNKHGLNTVAGIINRWAPSSENDTGSYITNVAKALNVDPNAPLDMKDPKVLAALGDAITVQENGGRTVPRPQLEKLPPMAMLPMPGRTPVDLMDVPDMPDKVDAPVETKPEAYLAAVNAANPDMTASMMERINKAVEKNKGSKDEAINFALLNAGLGMMASKSPHFLGAVGEGGIGAMKQLAGDLKDMRNRADVLDDKKDSVTMAQMAAARGNYRQAAELAEKSNSFANTRYGHDMYDRRSAINERSNVIRSNVSEKNAATRADSAMQQGVMSFNKGAVNADRQAVRDWNRGQIDMYRTDVRDGTQRELEAHKAALKESGNELKERAAAQKTFETYSRMYDPKNFQIELLGKSPEEVLAHKQDWIARQMSKSDRDLLGIPDPGTTGGKPRIQMNPDGSFRK